MARYRAPLPDDLKELIVLCRAGKLFAVQQWISTGKRFRLPPGKYSTSPFTAALATGFHSLVEVFLSAGIPQDEMDHALCQSVNNSRLDLIELLTSYGADIVRVCRESVICNRNPLILRWFVSHGMDLEVGNLIAYAFRIKNRGFLGPFMDIRDQVPSARKQASMALRFHAKNGNLKWVCLLIWAGADPRMAVPDLECSPPEEFIETALEDTISHGHVEIVRKIGIDASRDNPTELLSQYIVTPKPEIYTLLLDAGADPNGRDQKGKPMESLISNFEWSLDQSIWRTDNEPIFQCIELLASRGGRWNPEESYRLSCLRRAIGKAPMLSAISGLTRIIKSGAIDKEVFSTLMNTPKMKAFLSSSYMGVAYLREFAGQAKLAARRERTRSRARNPATKLGSSR